MMKRTGMAILLIGSWLILFFTLTFFTELIMAPWDTAIHLPEVGTWQRTLNDFFDFSVGKYLLSIPAILLSLRLVVTRRGTSLAYLGRLAAGNVLFVGALWVLFVAASAINNQILFPYPPVLYDPTYRGYHLSVFPMAVMLAACAGWVIWQRRVERGLTARAAAA